MTRILWILAGLLLGDGWRLRRRLRDVPVLDLAAPDCDHSYRVVSSIDVEVDEATMRAAASHASHHGLDALDLIPQGLSPEQLVDLLAGIQPEVDVIDNSLFAPGSGAHHATLISAELVDRLEDRGRLCELDDYEYGRLMVDIKRCAPRGLGYAMAPGLEPRAAPGVSEAERRLGSSDEAGPAIVGVELVVTLAALTAALRSWRRGGWALVAGYGLQPLIATVATVAAPTIHWLRAPLRAPFRLAALLRAKSEMDASPHRATGQQVTAEERAEYDELLAKGTGQFFEPRVRHCPICASTDLVEQSTMPDMLQGKPGRFRLERCQSCRVVFQNPRLSLAGLDFYYRDFYEGRGEAGAEIVFGASDVSYRGRADLLQDHVADPARWLDVGAGHGHFCVFAQGQFPDTSFEGLDMSHSIKEAERRGWIDVAHYGLFPDIAHSLEASFDVVSMHHYLEHTRDIRTELAAAAHVLKPGGAVMIELPDPESKWAERLGPFYGPWFQPQHQVIAPVHVIEQLLGEQGFTVRAVQRQEAHITADIALAGFLLINRVAPPAGAPWHRGSVLDKVRWVVGQSLLWPVWIVFGALEQIIGRRVPPKNSNAFRLVAVLDAEGAAA